MFFRCLIASSQSSLYHGLLFFGFVEVLGIHFSDIVIREDVKSVIGSEESERKASVRDIKYEINPNVLYSISIWDYDLHHESDCSQSK